jgi:hypothetical protein
MFAPVRFCALKLPSLQGLRPSDRTRANPNERSTLPFLPRLGWHRNGTRQRPGPAEARRRRGRERATRPPVTPQRRAARNNHNKSKCIARACAREIRPLGGLPSRKPVPPAPLACGCRKYRFECRRSDDPLIQRSRRPHQDATRAGTRARAQRNGSASRKEWAWRGGGYAARRYSRISPPSRSCRRTRPRSMTLAVASSLFAGSLLGGGRCPRERCGRCSL